MKKAQNGIFAKRIFALVADTAILAILVAGIYAAVYYAQLENLVFYVSVISLLVIYPIFFELLPMAATPGMMIFGIHIAFDDTKNASGNHAARVLLRAVLRIIFCLPAGFGFWYAFFEKRRRTLYDVFSSTFVTEAFVKCRVSQPCLVRKLSNGRKEVYPIGTDRVVIGRNPAVCNIVYPPNEAGVSRAHCSVLFNRQVNLFLIEDLGSSYGTFLADSRRLSAGKVFALEAGASFYVATKNNTFTVDFAENLK